MQDMSALKCFYFVFCDLRVLAKKLASPLFLFGHPTQVSMQVQLATTREPVWPGLYANIHLAILYKSNYFGVNLDSQLISRVTKFTASVLFRYAVTGRLT